MSDKTECRIIGTAVFQMQWINFHVDWAVEDDTAIFEMMSFPCSTQMKIKKKSKDRNK
jgi:hypothetical protein